MSLIIRIIIVSLRKILNNRLKKAVFNIINLITKNKKSIVNLNF